MNAIFNFVFQLALILSGKLRRVVDEPRFFTTNERAWRPVSLYQTFREKLVFVRYASAYFLVPDAIHDDKRECFFMISLIKEEVFANVFSLFLNVV